MKLKVSTTNYESGMFYKGEKEMFFLYFLLSLVISTSLFRWRKVGSGNIYESLFFLMHLIKSFQNILKKNI